MLRALRRLALVPLVSAVAACSRTGLRVGLAAETSTSTTTTSSGTGGAGGDGGGSAGGGAGGGLELSDLFAHGPTKLYRLDATTDALSSVGSFLGCDGPLIDLAMDRQGRLFGSTFEGFFRIDPGDASCEPLGVGVGPTSLAFVPPGTLDPDHEVLVGFAGSEYVRIDPDSGDSSTIGDLAAPGYASSGDVVSVEGVGTYLTVKGNGCSDCLAEVDPLSGALLGIVAVLPYTDAFGLAYYDGKAYGFTKAGQVFEIELATGVTAPVSIASPPSGLSFNGAASASGPLSP